MSISRPTFIQRAFTLIELMIVVSVLGILAAIVIPQFANSKGKAEVSAIAADVNSIQIKITSEFARTGDWPASVDSAWFIGGAPEHPQNRFGVTAIEVVSLPGTNHPPDKVLKAGVAGAFWYNPDEGAFRARVSDQGSAASTLSLYNQVNNCDETALGNY